MGVRRRQCHQPQYFHPPVKFWKLSWERELQLVRFRKLSQTSPLCDPGLMSKRPVGGIQIHSGSNLIQPQTKTPSIGNEKYGDRPTITEDIGDMTILPVGRSRGIRSRR